LPQFSSWTDALIGLVDQAEDAGVLVMLSGIVGNSTRRKLIPQEFPGFSLVDELAPTVVISGSEPCRSRAESQRQAHGEGMKGGVVAVSALRALARPLVCS
jgi:hypothetical protein